MDFTAVPSVRSETKAKFDALLKAALNKKSKSHSKQNLISDNESVDSAEEIIQEIVEVDVYEKTTEMNVENKTYIMDKFLNDSSLDQDTIEDTVFLKPPIPKPRKIKKNDKTDNNSSSSIGTYNCDSPESVDDKDSNNTNATFDIPKPRKRITKHQIDSITSNELKIHSETPSPTSESSKSSKAQKALTLELTKVQSDEKHNDDEMELQEIHYEDEIRPKAKERLKKLKKKLVRDDDAVEEEITKIISSTYNYEHVIGISLHRADRLELDSYVIHPIVKIHIVDSINGEYLKKSDVSRNVLFYNENQDIDYIGPILSQAFDLQENRSLFPNWEETILINEDFDYLSSNTNIMIFFEIMDFLSISLINETSQKGSLGWHKIAWAFLKPTSTKFSNTNKKVRLQLYYPRKLKKLCTPEKCSIFHWWQKKKFMQYPSTLHVTVKNVISPNKVIETFRSKTPHEIEVGNKNKLQTEMTKMANEAIEAIKDVISTEDNDVLWSRVEHQICKIPNKCIAEFDSFDDGSFVIKFSNSGKYLACSVLMEDSNSIVIYSVLSYEEVVRLPGHQGLIYDISWSKDDKILISASADCTVSIWNMETFKFEQMLPHPSFVYSCDVGNNLITTGCYDKLLRIWQLSEIEKEFELVQELEGHTGYITTICYNNDNSLFYSGDSSGMICEWKKILDGEWKLKREINILDIRGTIINQILLHKREKRLLINTRDNSIRMVDLKTSFILQHYHGAVNNRVQTTISFSPCCNFVISGSEDGHLYFWNTDTGKCEYVSKPYNNKLTIHCVQFHPKDNYLAISHYGNSFPILLFKYERRMEKNDEPAILYERGNSFGVIGDAKNEIAKSGRDGSINFKKILKKIDEIVSPR